MPNAKQMQAFRPCRSLSRAGWQPDLRWLSATDSPSCVQAPGPDMVLSKDLLCQDAAQHCLGHEVTQADCHERLPAKPHGLLGSVDPTLLSQLSSSSSFSRFSSLVLRWLDEAPPLDLLETPSQHKRRFVSS